MDVTNAPATIDVDVADPTADEVYNFARFMYDDFEAAARLYGLKDFEVRAPEFDYLPPAHVKTLLHVAKFSLKRLVGFGV